MGRSAPPGRCGRSRRTATCAPRSSGWWGWLRTPAWETWDGLGLRPPEVAPARQRGRGIRRARVHVAPPGPRALGGGRGRRRPGDGTAARRGRAGGGGCRAERGGGRGGGGGGGGARGARRGGRGMEPRSPAAAVWLKDLRYTWRAPTQRAML